jgi:hypothetical protein
MTSNGILPRYPARPRGVGARDARCCVAFVAWLLKVRCFPIRTPHLRARARTDSLGRLLEIAMRRSELCASDPLCADHVPGEGPRAPMHGAACHACLFVPETSCECGNRYLDRSLLVPTVADKSVAYIAATADTDPLAAAVERAAQALTSGALERIAVELAGATGPGLPRSPRCALRCRRPRCKTRRSGS